MQLRHAARPARLGSPALALALAVIGLLALPAVGTAAREPDVTASAGWHGRAIEKPLPRRQLADTKWPMGWSAGAIGPGTGYARPGGSKRVREVQRRLVQLGYRPGPADGLYGPRTRAATMWFQFKHGLRTTGRVNRPTLTVLQARSDHKPLEAKTRAPRPETSAPPQMPSPAFARAPAPQDGGSTTIVLALLLLVLALGVGVITGLIAPELRRPVKSAEPPATAPALRPPEDPTPPPSAPRRQRQPVRTIPVVVGYAVVEPDGREADADTAAIALRCARRGWSLVEVVQDGKQSNGRLAERPGLSYALRQIRQGAATGLVVARLRDVGARMTDLATLLGWLVETGAFLGAADHALDTSTRAGQATARAIIDLGTWERRLISQRTRDDLAYGRFTPRNNHHHGELTRQIATMHAGGLSMRAIAEALNVAGIATPAGRRRWQTTDVKAAAEEVRRN